MLKFNFKLAPIKVAVFPLVNKDGMPEKATEIYKDLQKQYKTQYDTSGAIGRRYRRQDEIGTPFCVTVDGQTLEDDTVTIRERDTMVQERINISQIKKYISDKLLG
jgi:glycyl-tRNA synthetase